MPSSSAQPSSYLEQCLEPQGCVVHALYAAPSSLHHLQSLGAAGADLEVEGLLHLLVALQNKHAMDHTNVLLSSPMKMISSKY